MFINLFQVRPRLGRVGIHVTASALVFLGSLVLSELLEQRNEDVLISNIKAVFRNDQNIGNTAIFGRRLADLENLGIIRCVRITSAALGEIYSTTFKEGCNSSYRLSSLRPATVARLNAITGESFEVSLRSTTNGTYQLYLNILILLSLALINGFLYRNYVRVRAKGLELDRELETSRLLEARVESQSKVIANLRIDAAVRASLLELATHVSHDIRSPLSAINMVVGSLSELQNEKREILQNAIARINGITRELLGRYKVQAKDLETTEALDCRPRSANELVARNIPEFLVRLLNEKRASFADKRGLSFKIDIANPADAICAINELDLSRALSNLINNAVEAVEGSSEPTVTVALRSAGPTKVAIIVNDNGKGIPDELLMKLGHERVTFGKANSESGSGIGVLQAKNAIESNRGKFQIQSRVGVGTQITVLLERS